MSDTTCAACGHAAKYHTGVGRAGYNAPTLRCTFETDRYEVCPCDKFKLSHDKALEAVVEADR